jgi:uncharacterized membrane protein YdjX (TVP38/TMEM64 family)
MAENEYPMTNNRLADAANGRFPNHALQIIKKYRGVLVVAAILLALGLLGWHFQKQALAAFSFLQDQEVVSAYIQQFGVLGPLVLGISQVGQVIFAFIPGHIFVLAGGYVYGFLPGLALNMLFVVTASQLAFYLAKKAGRPLVGKFVDTPTLDKWQAIADKRGIAFFTIAFILPIFPSDTMNYVAGLSGMDGHKFLIANFFGRLPGVTLMTLIGAYGLEVPDSAWWFLVLGVGVVYLIGRYVVMLFERQYTSEFGKRPFPQPTESAGD